MSFEETNYDENPDEGQLPEESNNNRTFLIAAGILGGLILISIACFAGVFLFTRNANQQAGAQAEAGTQTAQADADIINSALTATQSAALLPTATQPPTATQVVNVPTPTTATTAVANLSGTSIATTATVGAAYTQAAIAQLTIIPTTTALPKTGFAEDYGIPGLVVMSLAFIIVILAARRLRIAPSQ